MKWCSQQSTRYPSIAMQCGISIVGAGRTGRALGRRLHESGWKIHSVVTRSQSTARRAMRSIGAGRSRGEISRELFSAPVILVSVSDSAIESVVARLAAFGNEHLRRKIVLHTSGALGSGVLASLRTYGAAVGCIHPLQTFSGVGIPALDGRIFVIEGDPAAIRIARGIARSLTGQAIRLNPAARSLYHAAATITAGHVLALVESAVQLFISLGMKRREALKALLPLTRQVLENLERLGPRAAWTGPLARGDYGVVALHDKSLRTVAPEYLDAYRAMNRLAARVLASDPALMISELGKSHAKIESQSNLTGASA